MEKCSIDNANGGCSHTCNNPREEGQDLTCSCDETNLIINPSFDLKTCGNSFAWYKKVNNDYQ